MRLALLSVPAISCVLIAACGTPRAQEAAAPEPRGGVVGSRAMGGGSPQVQVAERLLIKQVTLALEADDPSALSSRITQVTTEAGGFVEQASNTAGERLDMQIRVPVAQLEAVITRLAQMAEIKQRHDSARDVTEETIDLEARLATLVALRDRLRGLLRSAANVQDVVAVERELARVQSDIDSMDARLTYLRSHVALAQLSIRVDRRRVLGPLGYLLAGVAWVVSKLFVIR